MIGVILEWGKNKKDGQPMRPWQSGSNHQGQRIQLWDINNMKQALQYYFTVNSPEYDGPCFGYEEIADVCNRLRAVCISPWVMGFG